LSKVDKYCLVRNLTKQLTDIVCSVGHDEFLAKFGLLEDLVNLWSANSTIVLNTVADIDDNDVSVDVNTEASILHAGLLSSAASSSLATVRSAVVSVEVNGESPVSHSMVC